MIKIIKPQANKVIKKARQKKREKKRKKVIQ